MKNWYCKPASEAEAIEIVERAVANGVETCDFIGSGGSYAYDWDKYNAWGCLSYATCTYNAEDWLDSEQLTIQQVREQFPLPHEVKVMSKKEWQGPKDGLPPAGAVCEVLYGKKWYKVKIIGIDDEGYAVFDSGEFGASAYDGVKILGHFRPLRTERDKWIDYVTGLVKPGAQTDESLAGEIYDALKSGSLKAPDVD